MTAAVRIAIITKATVRSDGSSRIIRLLIDPQLGTVFSSWSVSGHSRRITTVLEAAIGPAVCKDAVCGPLLSQGGQDGIPRQSRLILTGRSAGSILNIQYARLEWGQ